MKENILIVHNYYQIPGGEDVVVANEEKLLLDHGHKVIKYTRNNSELKSMSKPRMLGLFFTTIYNRRTVREVTRLIKDNNIDIVHVHNTLNLISPSVYYAARKCKVPVVQTIHNYRLICPGATFYREGQICEQCINGRFACALKYKCYRGSLLQTLTCVLTLKVNRLFGIYGKINYIALTDFARNKLIEANNICPDSDSGKSIDSDINSKLNSEAVGNGARTRKSFIFDPDRIFVKPNFTPVVTDKIISPANRNKQFIFAGRLDETKGVDLLLQAWNGLMQAEGNCESIENLDSVYDEKSCTLVDDLNPDKDVNKVNCDKEMGCDNDLSYHIESNHHKELKDYELIICGEGPLETYCKSYIKNNGLSNVKLLGKCSHEEVVNRLSRSKAMILPTRWYEGFPMSILESLSVGTPVIGPDMGNVGSIIEEGVSGYKYVSGDIESLQHAILRAMRADYSIYDSSFELYNENYTADKNIQMLEEIYESAH